MNIARVVIDRAAAAYDREYDYLLPDSISARPGCRVLVPFGAGDSLRVGMVLAVRGGQPDESLKPVRTLLDAAPLLDEEGLTLLRALRDGTFCTWFEAVRALVVPGAGMRLMTGVSAVRGAAAEELSPDARRLYEHLLARRSIADEQKVLSAVGLSPGAPALEELVACGLAVRSRIVKKRIADERAVMARLTDSELPFRFTPRQRAVAELLSQVGCASVKEICYFAGVTRAVVERMRKNGAVELFEEIVPREIRKDGSADVRPPREIALNAQQQRAFDELCALSQTGRAETALLYGVTGSGKTQVFLKLIEQVLSRGKKAMVLIPEISLTPQTVALFSARFGPKVAVLHSSLSMTRRLDEWRRIREGGADIVVGTRSAVFAPLSDIGLIVVDEEQEHTYHSESAPRYHAREMAMLRAKTHRALLLLCSATPSVESYHSALTGKYRLVTLTERYQGVPLPEVQTIDMRTAPLSAFSSALTEELCEQISQTLSRREQAILLLNRRGYNTLVRCSSCGETAKCPHCSIPLTYHAANRRLMCHYCGYSREEYAVCPSCSSAMLRYAGVGTQRAEQELQAVFPKARILRMDTDTTMSRHAHRRGFEAFANGEYDIMLGTQMVAKGLDFPNVTLVGVLSADQSLYADDFRGFERTFSLITQVVGRSGRAEKPGRAVIQTFTPENRILALAAAQDYTAFFREEISYRRAGLYPPFCDMVCAVFSDQQQQTAARGAQLFCRRLIEQAKERYPDLPMRILGPAEGSPFRVAGRYRYRLLIKCRANRAMRALLRGLFDWYHAQPKAPAMSLDFYYDSNV